MPHKSNPSRKHNVPAQPGPLLGRDRELRLAGELLLAADSPVRLLTLTGPGGTGKTRLAVGVAARLLEYFDDGVYFVDLAPIDDARLVPWAITRTLELRDTGTPLMQRLVDFLQHKRVLLLLDNFEHVVDAAPELSRLLSACENLTILVTSRARLRLRWEHVLVVPPLEVPDLRNVSGLGALATIPSVDLFLRRARAIDPGFALTTSNAADIAELCVRLDGLPLALELAAARVDVLPLQSMLAQPLQVLSSGASDVPPRHSTMRRAIAWSYDQLAAQEQALLRRIAIFPAGCVAAGAAAVAASPSGNGRDIQSATLADGAVLDDLGTLVSKSLLRQDKQPDGQLRFGMLETIRTFALEQLAEHGELEQTGQRFRDFFLQLAERAEPELTGHEQALWLDRLEREHDNVRFAIRWCLEHGDADDGLRLAGALWRFWFMRHHVGEGDRLTSELLDMDSSALAGAATRAKALNGGGNLAHARGDLERAARLHRESLTLRRLLGDRRGIAISLNSLGNVVVDTGDYEGARNLHEASLDLRRELRDERGIAVTLNNLSVIARDQGDWQRAADLSAESAARFRELGDTQGVALSLVTLSVAHYHLGHRAKATELYHESLALFGKLDNKRDIAEWLEVLAILACTHNQPERAARLFGAADGAVERIGSTMGPARHARYKGFVAEIRDRLGERSFAAEWEKGRTMRLEDATETALATEPVAAALEVKQAAEPVSRHSTLGVGSRSGLTRREQEVLALLARGLTNREIAKELTIAERTAETHVGRVLGKLGLTRRAQLTAWAIRHGL